MNTLPTNTTYSVTPERRRKEKLTSIVRDLTYEEVCAACAMLEGDVLSTKMTDNLTILFDGIETLLFDEEEVEEALRIRSDFYEDEMDPPSETEDALMEEWEDDRDLELEAAERILSHRIADDIADVLEARYE